MTKNFDNFFKRIAENGMIGGDVLGNTGAYDVSDPRTPNVLGSMQRRNKCKRKKHKRK